MIKLSKLTDYAVVILYEMAREGGVRLSAASLAERTRVPEPTVAKILKLLVRKDLIISTRGIKGGYALEKKPDEVRVRDVIAAIEGPVTLTACIHDGKECPMEDVCALKSGWQVVNNAVEESLGRVTLADMMK